MGRKKIQITRIQDERNRQITFSKRKAGLLKKAYELSILCDVDIAVIMITHNSKLYQYASSNMNSILIRYTEFKDPDESKTNADILDDITKKEKGGRDSGDEEDGGQIPLTPNTQAHYQRIDEEFDQVLHHSEIAQVHPTTNIPPPIVIPKVPQVMPVSVPVTKPLRLTSTGSSSNSPTTPSSVKTPHSNNSMPPPVGTPTRLQTIRSQTLKLHLPGSGRNYIPLGGSSSTPGKSPLVEEVSVMSASSGGSGGGGGDGDGDGSHVRPHLRVVIPGQKGFVLRNRPSSPSLMDVVAEESPTTPPVINDSALPTIMTNEPPPPPKAPMLPNAINTDPLTTPIMTLTTPNILSSLPQGMPNLAVDLPNLSDTGSALVAFPVSIQPSSIASNTPSNIILQAQNMGQPFLLTQTSHDRQNSLSNVGSSLQTPPVGGGGASSLRDLEQLKLQYDKIYQQISQTLQQHAASSYVNLPTKDEIILDNKKDDSEGTDEMVIHQTTAGSGNDVSLGEKRTFPSDSDITVTVSTSSHDLEHVDKRPRLET